MTVKVRVAADVWEKDVWEFQAKSGSSGSCRLLLHFLGKIAVQEMSFLSLFFFFVEFLPFSACEEFLVFSSVFPFFSRDLRGSVGIKILFFFGGFFAGRKPGSPRHPGFLPDIRGLLKGTENLYISIRPNALFGRGIKAFPCLTAETGHSDAYPSGSGRYVCEVAGLLEAPKPRKTIQGR